MAIKQNHVILHMISRLYAYENMDIFDEQASGKLKEAKSFWGYSAKRSSHKSLIYVRMEK